MYCFQPASLHCYMLIKSFLLMVLAIVLSMLISWKLGLFSLLFVLVLILLNSFQFFADQSHNLVASGALENSSKVMKVKYKDVVCRHK